MQFQSMLCAAVDIGNLPTLHEILWSEELVLQIMRGAAQIGVVMMSAL